MNLFDSAAAQAVEDRVASLTPESKREWGKMGVAQTVAHCSLALEMALGEKNPPRVFVGRIFGPLVKKLALGNDEPMRKNSPTAPSLIVSDDRDLEAEKVRLIGLIGRFSKGGAAICTSHPHAFFGKLTPEQWAELMYKRLDHHAAVWRLSLRLVARQFCGLRRRHQWQYLSHRHGPSRRTC